MKVTVIKTFQDAITGQHYHAGDVINITDAKRVSAMEDLKLVEVTEQKITKKASRKLED